MGELQATVEFSIELHKFYNVDLFQRGLYQMQVELKLGSQYNHQIDVTHVNGKICPNSANASQLPARVSQNKAFSQTFEVLYRNEEVLVEDVFHFKCHLLLNVNKLLSALEEANFQFCLDLLFCDDADETPEDAEFQHISSRTLKLHFSPHRGLHYHLPVLFDYFHLSAISVSIHASLVAIQQPSVLSPQVKSSQRPSKSCGSADQSPSHSLESILSGVNGAASASATSTYARQVHYCICSLLLACNESLQTHLVAVNQLLPQWQRLSISAVDCRARLLELCRAVQTVVCHEDLLAVIGSHVTRLSAEVTLLWQQFLELSTRQEQVRRMLARRHHILKVKRLAELVFTIDNPRSAATGCFDSVSDQYLALTEALRQSDYLQSLPPLPVECAELDGEPHSLPIVYEERYQHVKDFASRKGNQASGGVCAGDKRTALAAATGGSRKSSVNGGMTTVICNGSQGPVAAAGVSVIAGESRGRTDRDVNASSRREDPRYSVDRQLLESLCSAGLPNGVAYRLSDTYSLPDTEHLNSVRGSQRVQSSEAASMHNFDNVADISSVLYADQVEMKDELPPTNGTVNNSHEPKLDLQERLKNSFWLEVSVPGRSKSMQPARSTATIHDSETAYVDSMAQPNHTGKHNNRGSLPELNAAPTLTSHQVGLVSAAKTKLLHVNNGFASVTGNIDEPSSATSVSNLPTCAEPICDSDGSSYAGMSKSTSLPFSEQCGDSELTSTFDPTPARHSLELQAQLSLLDSAHGSSSAGAIRYSCSSLKHLGSSQLTDSSCHGRSSHGRRVLNGARSIGNLLIGRKVRGRRKQYRVNGGLGDCSVLDMFPEGIGTRLEEEDSVILESDVSCTAAAAVNGRELSCDCYTALDEGDPALQQRLSSAIGRQTFRFLSAKEKFKEHLRGNFQGSIYSDYVDPVCTLPYFLIPDDYRPFSSAGLHLVVCVHGLDGNAADLRLVRTYLELGLPGANLEFLMSERNQGDTFSDLDTLTDRLVEEIVCHISAYRLRPVRISFVGHSLGCVIVHNALSRASMAPYLDRLHAFLSLSGPHLGTLYNTSGLVNMGMWFMQKLKKSASLLQLAMRDAPRLRQTFMYRLAAGSQLHRFRHLLLTGSSQDKYVPLHSARIEPCKSAVRDRSDSGSAYREMIELIVGPIVDRPDGTLLRYNIHHALAKSTSAFIGRAAHIAALDSEIFIEKFMQVAALKYFK